MKPFFQALMLASLLLFMGQPVQAEEGPTPEDVAFVQRMLERFGYNPGPIDGICGDLTTAAVRAFHDDRGLPLEPGKIEPQAATVVANLTTHFAQHVIEPVSEPGTIYRSALAGDAAAAEQVAVIYNSGQTGIADEMMAYVWWSVAEMRGQDEAAQEKAELAASGVITPHEMNYAKALAKQIHTLSPDGTGPSDGNAVINGDDADKTVPGVTM